MVFPVEPSFMKTRFIIVTMALVALASCHSPQRQARQMVARAELLFDTMPDSTVRLIDSVLRMPVYFNEKRRMDMALLQGEALFGDRGQEIPPLMDEEFFDDKPFFSTSPELERAAAYYASKKEYDKAAHAALYSGFVQQHYNENKMAMQSFKDAERYGEMVKDSLSVARAQYWMGKMLYHDYLESEAIAAFKSADLGFGTRYTERALTQNMLAACFMVVEDYENAETCLRKSLYYAEQRRSDLIRRKTLNNYSVLYRILGEYDKAIDCIRRSKGSEDKSYLPILYLNMGIVYSALGESDSAAYYFHQIEPFLLSSDLKKETKASAYNALSRFAERQGNTLLALQYREQRESLLSQVTNQIQEQTVYRIQKQYDYETLQNVLNRRLAHTQLVITLVIVLLLGIVALSLYRSVQRNKREAEINANLFHFMQHNKELIKHNAEHEKRHLDQTQQLSNLLFGKFQTMQKLDCYMKGKGDKIILKDLEKTLFEGKGHIEAIMEVLDELYPDLQETLKTKYPEMSDLECQVYILSRFKLPRVEEAALLNISTSVLDKVRGRVRKMMENAH